MAIEQARRQQQEQQPVAPPTPRAEDVGHEPPPADPGPEVEPPTDISEKAQRRITELVNQLRQKDQEMQQTLAAQNARSETVQQLEARLAALAAQHEKLLQQNLSNLDPETRAEVVASARVQELVQQTEQRLMGTIRPALQRIEENAMREELRQVASRFPKFDPDVHVPLIEQFRKRNSACTIEQAFRAIATPEELQLGGRSAAVVPPIVSPTGGRAATHQRFMPEQPKQSNPHEELAEDARRIRELAQQGKATPRDWQEHLKKRLS